ncbi:hypothetical protein M427DRAFT_123923 [Gonapodya prolifera JEL478]|uniref:Uncharacterized protein n=1 Tax=Gonapodya prolifera (strain JEL478) TaxID=1344416 RepID=A0A139ADZ7_GONPJ|nr:hypothetical protein M427DRAFT_123923 [Gonapodya prolifera JEL478]|eukprot:KXS14988.1 hypothetical protein M427DRAFT_123923 [Gonapodya prolifera JEL478]
MSRKRKATKVSDIESSKDELVRPDTPVSSVAGSSRSAGRCDGKRSRTTPSKATIVSKTEAASSLPSPSTMGIDSEEDGDNISVEIEVRSVRRAKGSGSASKQSVPEPESVVSVKSSPVAPSSRKAPPTKQEEAPKSDSDFMSDQPAPSKRLPRIKRKPTAVKPPVDDSDSDLSVHKDVFVSSSEEEVSSKAKSRKAATSLPRIRTPSTTSKASSAKAKSSAKSKGKASSVRKGSGKASTSAKRKASSKEGDDSDFALENIGSSSSSSESDEDVAEESSAKATDEENGAAPGSSSASAARNNRSRGPRQVLSLEERLRRRKERNDKEFLRVIEHHPELNTTWEGVDLQAPVEHDTSGDVPSVEQPEELRIKLLPFQKDGVAWMIHQENETVYGGGILADEMGMGKTLQAISLILSTPAEDGKRPPTLVLTPTVALLQWQAEINRHTAQDTLRICLFHGSERTNDSKELSEYDVVLSTYAIVEQGFRKERYGVKRKGEMVKEPSALHGVDWYRVILDEAHSIKDRTSSTARAVFSLKAQKKWSLSGTPLQNRVGELYSLVRFLKCDPYSYYYCKMCDCKSLHWAFKDGRTCDSCGHKPMSHFNWWNAEILKPIVNFGHEHESGALAFRKLARLLDRIMLRRTKTQKAADLGLPPKVVVVRRDYFGEEEEDLYNSLYGDAKRKFDTYVAEDTVLNHYANIFELLMKMRQAANHPDLVTKKGLVASEAAAKSLVCGICSEPAEDAIISKCKHTFCREDAREYIESAVEETPKCPVCFRPLTIDLSQEEVLPQETGSAVTVKKSIVNYLDMSTWRSSTKIEALVEELTGLKRRDATVKSIVFSQFVNFLDLVQWRLKRSGFECVKLDGRMSPQQRDTIINEFMTNVNIDVFLISLKAGGIALNLTEASHVFLMDPWWNPAVEEQAMDRIHRLGQHRPIKITRIIIENSIESRIIQLQQKKKAMFDSTVGKDMSALARLTPEDFEFLFVN